jgi:hypothetical protein
MNTSGGTEEPESPFRSFGEGRKSPTPDGKAISGDGENEKRDRTDTLSKSVYAPTSPVFSANERQ